MDQGSQELEINWLLDIGVKNEVFTPPELTNKKSEKKQVGRWGIFQSQRYLEVMKNNKTNKNIIRQLKTALPNRAQTQIRAHHQKMMKKYGSVENIIKVVGRTQNKKLIQIGQRIDERISKIQNLANKLANVFVRENNLKQEGDKIDN